MTDGSKENNEKTELLREILKWIKFEGMQRVKGLLADVLQKDIEKIVYQFSDGRSSGDVGKLAGVSHQTVVNYWKRWSTLGIVEAERARGGTRYRRIFSLENFGIEVPQPKEEKGNEQVVPSKETTQTSGEEIA